MTIPTKSRAHALVLALALGVSAITPDALRAERGVLEVKSRPYRSVIATCFRHPFLTDADMRMYVTDTRGRVATSGGPASFYYPGIRQVLLNRTPLLVLRSGPDLLQVRMPAGEHDVAIVASGRSAATQTPAGIDRDGTVDAIDQFNARAKALKPGDELVVANGVYAGWGSAVVDASGTAGRPIIIRPQTPGGAVFRGRTHIRLSGKHVVFKGFRFEQAGPAHVLYLSNGEHLRVTQCQFFSCGDSLYTYAHIVRLAQHCHRSRVDHCFFTGSKSMSIGLRVYKGP